MVPPMKKETRDPKSPRSPQKEDKDSKEKKEFEILSMKLLEELPPKIAESCGKIKELDALVEDTIKETKVRLAAYVKNMKKLSKEEKARAYKEIDELYVRQEKLANQKVRIANDLYDLLDKDIKAVDAALHSSQRQVTSDGSKKKRKGDGQSDDVAAVMPTVDMPIDPNEPIYCICHQVSFGDMIACDNPLCRIEWYHYQCVGLLEPPPGDWYCDACKKVMELNPDSKKKKKRH